MTVRTNPASSVLHRIKRTLVGLRMPRALEMVEVTVRQLERGEVTPLEAIEGLLAEELSLRESRRIKLGGDEAVIGVDRIVLPPRPGRLVARLLDRQLDLATLLGVLGAPRFHGADRRLNAERLDPLDHLGTDGAVDPQAAE